VEGHRVQQRRDQEQLPSFRRLSSCPSVPRRAAPATLLKGAHNHARFLVFGLGYGALGITKTRV
jgi:hypothetical protein